MPWSLSGCVGSDGNASADLFPSRAEGVSVESGLFFQAVTRRLTPATLPLIMRYKAVRTRRKLKVGTPIGKRMVKNGLFFQGKAW
jgi:hypothetical protein